ncbi:hypothetical protein AB6D66_00550 [Vibrio pomeroyi]|uniref:Uncharacterized protein n=1 Tax=Vibrio pomeroyi TaxID=198832 RepID=A0ABV4MQX8_9VIBR|nr:hypothetical protein [Vibrio atlanticus]MCZ4311039.1 hypothetical protein [Vibrio atlanticus]
MTDSKTVSPSNSERKRDFFAAIGMAGLYIFSATSGAQLGYMFSSLFLFHFGVLYMTMKRDKMFGVDIMHLLIPVAVVGYFSYMFAAKEFAPGDLAKIIGDDPILWFGLGLVPAFIHRGFHHYFMRATK